jgi:uncharacterized protein YegP (UPF0339 family)
MVKSKSVRRWFWRVVAKNGQTVLTSQLYASKWNAKRQAKKLQYANS